MLESIYCTCCWTSKNMSTKITFKINVSEDLGSCANATQNVTLALGQRLFLLLIHPVVWCMMMETILFCKGKGFFILYKIGKIFQNTRVDSAYRFYFWRYQILMMLELNMCRDFPQRRPQIPSQWQPVRKVENNLLMSANIMWWEILLLHV